MDLSWRKNKKTETIAMKKGPTGMICFKEVCGRIKQNVALSGCAGVSRCAKRGRPVENCGRGASHEVVVLFLIGHLVVDRKKAEEIINTMHELGYVAICVVKKVTRVIFLQ